ncbi:hypothetical protein [Phaeobacter sp.]|uniref:hypothetical protein n=1 Tax=Phaeobacter sp. TaxID=1902409 RepID=UPI0025D10B1B|nr:hypothetical protein [Phaeobacter sp.]
MQFLWMIPGLIALVSAAPLAASDAASGVASDPGAALSAEEFDSYTRGKTLFYGSDGRAYGVERYLPNRQVLWSFLDGRCQEGEWFPKGEEICFVYDNIEPVQCWRFSLTDRGLIAQYQSRAAATELYEAEDYGEEMLCLGPEVGA